MLSLVQRTPTPALSPYDLVAEGTPPVLARVLSQRPVDSVEEALGRYRLLPYHSLKGMPEMARALAEGIARQEKMVVVADYDCDGATACTVAVAGLRALGADITFVVPNRFIHGYGLTPSVVETVKPLKPRWIITVDNGIASHAGIEAAHAAGIGVLVTDHHLPGDTVPDTEAIVNPNQPGCPFPSKHLAGCGVMYYVLAATRDTLRAEGWGTPDALDMASLLDVVALGTVADVVRLDANNRWLVKQGLIRIRHGLLRPGLAALFKIAGRDPQRAQSQDFGFALGPRINAAGRLEDMSIGIRCLLSETLEEALPWAEKLNELNMQRKAIEQEMKEEAWAHIDISGQEGQFTRVAAHASFHEGVIGIVAGRIKEEAHTPTVVFAPAQEDGFLKGSGRSIPGVHLRDVLDLVHKRGHGLFTKFGGHAMAAGMTLPSASLPVFKTLFEEAVSEALDRQLPGKVLAVDGALASEDLSIDTAYTLGQEVWGQGFEEPVWVDEFELLEARLIGQDKHLKMRVGRGEESWDALHFFSTDLPTTSRVRLAYTLSVNEFRGNIQVQLLVVHREEGVETGSVRKAA